jgi:hypothetical protein
MRAPIIAIDQTVGTPIRIVGHASVTGGKAPFTWALENAPAWLTVSGTSTSGILAGRVGEKGTYTPTIKVTDANGRSATAQFSLDTTVSTLVASIATPSFTNTEPRNFYCVLSPKSFVIPVGLTGGRQPLLVTLRQETGAVLSISFDNEQSAIVGVFDGGDARRDFTFEVKDDAGQTASVKMSIYEANSSSCRGKVLF